MTKSTTQMTDMRKRTYLTYYPAKVTETIFVFFIGQKKEGSTSDFFYEKESLNSLILEGIPAKIGVNS